MKSNIKLNIATEQIHVAAQYLAMAGKYYVKSRPDDSHTNLDWDIETKQFASHQISDHHARIFLRPSDLRLGVGTDPENLLAVQNLQGLTQEEGSIWMRGQLTELNLDPEKYEINLHYDLPPYGDFDQQTFNISDTSSQILFSELRGWAKEILRDFKKEFKMSHDDRTWPHHFDHACYVPLLKNNAAEVIASLNFGLAIHDHLQPSHYFYVTHWAVEQPSISDPPSLSDGRWEMEHMNGALLPILMGNDFDLVTLTERTHVFLREAVDASKKFLKIGD